MQLDSIKRDKSKTITNTKGSFQEDLLEEEKIGRRQTQAQSLMQRVVDDTDNIQDTQNTMREISELMNNFSQKIMEQDEIVTTIMHDAEASNANIKEAGKELKKAHEYQKGQDKLVAAIYIIMALILLIYDRVTAIHY